MAQLLQVQIKGVKRVNKFYTLLPISMEKEIISKSEEFMRRVQKSAKLRAPRFTGRLAESIKVIKNKKNEIKIIVDSPYGAFQEYGFKPHFIHSDMSDRIGGTVGGLFNQANSLFFVSKFKPFIAPALEHNLSNLPIMLSDGAKKAVEKARGVK